MRHPDHEVRFESRALRCGWPAGDQDKAAMVARIERIVTDRSAPDRTSIQAFNALLKKDELNLRAIEVEIKERETYDLDRRIAALEAAVGGRPEWSRPRWEGNGNGQA
jgi:hypothetical protein